MLGGACDACQKWRCAHRAWMMECRRGNIYIYFPDACGDGSSTCMQVGDSLKVTARCRHSNGQGRRQERTARSPLAGFSRSGERYGLRNFALGHYIVQFASASARGSAADGGAEAAQRLTRAGRRREATSWAGMARCLQRRGGRSASVNSRPGAEIASQMELLRVGSREARVLRCQRGGVRWRITERLKSSLTCGTPRACCPSAMRASGRGEACARWLNDAMAERGDARAGREPGRARGSASGRRKTSGDAARCSSTASRRARQGRGDAARDAGHRGAGGVGQLSGMSCWNGEAK